MKHYNDDSKKLIKNVVSLAVSALLLAAATFAWFSTSQTINLASISAGIDGAVQLDYTQLTVPVAKFLDGNSTALSVKTKGESNSNPPSIKDYVTSASGWGSSSGSWDIDSMYPGEFGVYKISYTSDGSTKKLMLDTVTCADVNAKKSIYVYALAQKTAATPGATPTDITSDTKTLETLMSNVSQSGTIDVLTGITSSSGDVVDVYYVIGMPATDNASVHNALRQTGATVSITSIDVVDSVS